MAGTQDGIKTPFDGRSVCPIRTDYQKRGYGGPTFGLSNAFDAPGLGPDNDFVKKNTNLARGQLTPFFRITRMTNLTELKVTCGPWRGGF